MNNDESISEKLPEEMDAGAGVAGGKLSTQATKSTLEDASIVDGTFSKAAFLAVSAYCFFMIYSYHLVPSEDWEYLQGGEQQAAALAFVVLFVSIIVQAMQIFVGAEAGGNFSGIMVAISCVMSVALVTNGVLAFCPTIVAFDRYTNARVFIGRWCEWVPLAGLMTYLSEAVDIPREKNGYAWPIFTGVMQSISCFCAFVFPHCTSFFWWSVWMTVSMVTYGAMFPRLWIKRQRFLEAQKGPTGTDLEIYERRKFAYLLMACCTTVWSFLVVIFFVNMYIHVCLPEEHPFRIKSLAMIVDTTFDVVAKVVYMRLIVDVHHRAFSIEGRVRRQLGELRRLLSVLWNSSSDVIFISVKAPGKSTTMVSPSFPKLVGYGLPEAFQTKKDLALLYEIRTGSKREYPQGDDHTSSKVSFVDSSALAPESSIVSSREATDPVLIRNGLLLIQAAWKAVDKDGDKSSMLIVQKLLRKDGEECHCEIKVSQNGENALVAVVRDVTERHRRFEAERQAHQETMARQKDAHNVNRFTRHEVKNGLLAGIELCDSLRNAIDEVGTLANGASTDNFDDALVSDKSLTPRQGVGESSTKKCINDLDNLLHEVLDTVLAEAMAREVIHEVYRPRLERVDIKGTVTASAWGVGRDRRFPLTVDADMPYLMLDPQLVKYVHRNAISNACKYGKPDGIVTTNLRYDKKTQVLRLEVVNEPGPGHSILRDMGEEASHAVFKQGSRLHSHIETEDSRVSSGDGAWIMQKCARTLGGKCNIRFDADRTVFSFDCPASPLYVTDWSSTKSFRVPAGTWGIAIDDSRIQRKLMDRILSNAGVEEAKRIVLGAQVSDVEKLQGMLRGLLQADQHSKFLVLVDENLDFGNGDAKHFVLSGSKAMSEFLSTLPPVMERRLLVLIRSANDSAEDIVVYTERTHGFFPKAPMQQDRVCEILAPLWAQRFSREASLPSENEREVEFDTDEEMTRQELKRQLSLIDLLLEADHLNWKEVWSALHSFKGDIMTMGVSPSISEIVSDISSWRGDKTPPDFEEAWFSTRQKIAFVVE